MKKNDNISYYITLITQLGLNMVISIAIGLLIGSYIDKKYKNNGFFTLIGIIIGIGAGFLNTYRLLKPLFEKKDKD